MYRIAANEVTGYSPFRLLKGREPRLPLESMLGVHTPATFDDEEKYMTHLSTTLREAYAHAQSAQARVKARDKARRDARQHDITQHDIVRGDMVMYWEPVRSPFGDRAAADQLPQKLLNRWSGPHRVLASCGCGLHRHVIHVKRRGVVKAHVNRLSLFRPYGDGRITSNDFDLWDERDEGQGERDNADCDEKPPRSWQRAHEVGDLVAVPVDDADEPFLIGRLVQKRPKSRFGHLVQWLGNPKGDPNGTYLPGWVQPKPRLHYFRKGKQHATHELYTNDTRRMRVGDEMFMPIRVELQNDRLPLHVRELIEPHLLTNKADKKKAGKSSAK